MKITYRFATGETVDIEVPDDIGEVSVEIDKEICLSDRRETRRHESYGDDDDRKDPSADVETEAINGIETEALHKAIKTLLPQQQELIRRVFFEGMTVAGIAREEGVNEAAIRDRLRKIYRKLKNILG